VKVSISLADADVEFVDEYARAQGFRSRSAVIQQAVRFLRASELGGAYAAAWQDWESGGDAEDWERTAADGLTTEA
jgi:Arc/MetJ-type ribon-helix-helix transcriptional regulator